MHYASNNKNAELVDCSQLFVKTGRNFLVQELQANNS